MMKLKRSFAAVLAAAALGAFAAPAGADVPLTVLGTDAANDAPPGSDLLELAAGIHGPDLHIQFHMTSIPGAGTYGPLAGIEWIFKSNGKTFLAEAFPDGADFGYILFEKNGDAWTQTADLKGNFDTVNGLLDIFVPLKTIGAKKGTKITGAGADDVDIHVHAGLTTSYPDVMTTEKGITVR